MRKSLRSTLMVAIILASILLFDVPIIGLMILPSSLCALFWLRNDFDPSDETTGNCTTPRCSLMFALVSYGLSIPLLLFDLLVNAKEVLAGNEISQFHSTSQRSRFPHVLTLLLDSIMLLVAGIVIVMARNYDAEMLNDMKLAEDNTPQPDVAKSTSPVTV